MNGRIYFSFLILVILCVWWMVSGTGDLFADEPAVVMIAHKNVPETDLSEEDIRQIFLGQKTLWDNNKPVHFAILDGGDIHETFLRQYVGKTPSQFTNYWKKMIFTGKAQAPPSFDTVEALVQYVAENDGAVAYAPPSVPGEAVRILPLP